MPTILHDPQSNQYHIRFRFAGREFKRSLKTDQKSEATASLARLTETISLVRRGVLDLPAEADPVTFLLSGGRTRSITATEPTITLGQLFTKYQRELPEQAKEVSTLKTETAHIKIFRKKNKLPLSKPLGTITTHDVQQFINSESRRKVNGHRLSPDTVKREIDTLKCILNWAEKQQLIQQAPSLRGLIYGKRDEKPPFMTRAEIERIIARGGMNQAEVDELWDALYLTIPEVHEILEFVRTHARYPYIYPMFAFVAFTEARRSENGGFFLPDSKLFQPLKSQHFANTPPSEFVSNHGGTRRPRQYRWSVPLTGRLVSGIWNVRREGSPGLCSEGLTHVFPAHEFGVCHQSVAFLVAG